MSHVKSRKCAARFWPAPQQAQPPRSAGFPHPRSRRPAPMKIGLLTVKTGPLAQGGIQMEQGVLTFLKETDYTMAGRKVDLISADTGGAPAGAKTKVQELVERDKVDVILGPLATFELYAINDYIQQQKMPTISLAAADNLTQRQPNPYLVRASATSSQALQPMGHYAATEMKLKRVVAIGEDLAFDYEELGGFQAAFEKDGGCVVSKLWPPLVTPDYTPYIAQIGDCDGVCQGFAGSNPLRFMKAYADAGIEISGGDGRNRRRRRLAQEALVMKRSVSCPAAPIRSISKPKQPALHRRHGEEFQCHSRLLCCRPLRQLPGGRGRL